MVQIIHIEQFKKIDCPQCWAQLKYQWEDVHYEDMDFPTKAPLLKKYIECPNCGHHISVGTVDVEKGK